MSTIRGVKDRRFKFVQLLNEMFEDPNISLKAKGFIGFCLTKKDDWIFHIEHLISVLKEGRDAIYSTINECIENGYVYRHQTRDEKGRASVVEFIISDSKLEISTIKKEIESDQNFKKFLPKPEKADTEAPCPEKADTVFPGENSGCIYSNTNSSNTQQQQEQQSAVAEKKPSSESIKYFSPGGIEKNITSSEIYLHFSKLDFQTETIQRAIKTIQEKKNLLEISLSYWKSSAKILKINPKL